MALAIAATCVSCVTQESASHNIMAIHKGMTMDEVLHLFNKPQYRRFNQEGEEWEYKITSLWNDDKMLVIQFEDQHVVGMDSYVVPAKESTNNVVTVDSNTSDEYDHHHFFSRRCSDEEFHQLYASMKSEAFNDDKMKLLALGVDHKLFTCEQAIKLMSQFSFSDERMDVLEILAPRIVDKERVSSIIKKYPLLDEDKIYALFMKSR